jgi:Holliday junction resolvase RusA-like endonuclease
MGNDDPVAFKEDGWQPLQNSDVPSEVWEQFKSQSPDTNVFRQWLAKIYSQQIGENFEVSSATQKDLKRFSSWLGFQTIKSGFVLGFRNHHILQTIFYNDQSSKITIVSQRHCSICRIGRPEEELLPIHTFSIRTTPISRQATRSDTFKAFKKALKAHFSQREIGLGQTGRICLSLTFVLNKRKRDRDLDNMTKALLDALASALGFNDRHVHHLDIVKLIFPDTEEYLYVGLAPSALNEHLDVINPVMHFSWVGTQRIDLADFLPASSEEG